MPRRESPTQVRIFTPSLMCGERCIKEEFVKIGLGG
jgi:hypothetical protein